MLGDKLQRFALLLDAGVDVDVAPLSPALPSLEQQLSAWAAFTGLFSNNLIPQACLDVNRGAAWRCLAAQTALPFVRSDLIIRAPLYDSGILAAGGLASAPSSEAETAVAEAVRAATEKALLSLEVASRVLPACHESSIATAGDAWRAQAVSGWSMESALQGWVFDTSPSAPSVPSLLADSCVGWGCGPGCTRPGKEGLLAEQLVTRRQ